MGEITVVFDTNVLVSALGWNKSPEQCLEYALRGDIAMCLSPATASELWRVLGYEHLPFNDDDRVAFYTLVFDTATLVTPKRTISASVDPDDDKFLELAIAGTADVVVSGDSDLIELEEYEGVAIVDPATFLEAWVPGDPER